MVVSIRFVCTVGYRVVAAWRTLIDRRGHASEKIEIDRKFFSLSSQCSSVTGAVQLRNYGVPYN